MLSQREWERRRKIERRRETAYEVGHRIFFAAWIALVAAGFLLWLLTTSSAVAR